MAKTEPRFYVDEDDNIRDRKNDGIVTVIKRASWATYVAGEFNSGAVDPATFLWVSVDDTTQPVQWKE